MPLLRDHPDDLRALIGLTADARGIRDVFVEKDFWVTEVLRAATAPREIPPRIRASTGCARYSRAEPA